MKTFAQGEIYGRKVDTLPENLTEFTEKNKKGDWIISHSESGHHHLLERTEGVRVFEKTENVNKGMRVLYAILENPTRLFQDADIPHEAHELSEGVYKFSLAREYDPLLKQARRVAD